MSAIPQQTAAESSKLIPDDVKANLAKQLQKAADEEMKLQELERQADMLEHKTATSDKLTGLTSGLFEPGSMALGSKSHENGREGSHLHQFDENKPQSMRRTSFSIDSEPFREESGKASDLPQYSVDESMAVYRTVWNAVSADKRDLREVLSTDFADVDMRQFVPRDPVSSELTSLGSVLHLVGDCKRCVYVDNSTCRKGEMCLFCHFRHEGPVANGPSKKKRLRLRAKKGITHTGDVSGLPQEALTFGETGLAVI